MNKKQFFFRSSKAIRNLLPTAPGQQGGQEPGRPQAVTVSHTGGRVGGKTGVNKYIEYTVQPVPVGQSNDKVFW